MTIETEAFLKIEESLSQRLMKSWNRVALDLAVEVQKATRLKKWDDARKIAYSLNAEPVYKENEKYIRYSTYAALGFGATRLNDTASETIVMKEDYSDVVNAAMNLVKITIEHNLVKLARDKLLLSIDEMEGAEKIGTVSLIKAERRRLAQEFVSFKEEGDAMLQLVSSLNTSRVSAYGFTAEAEVLGVDIYKVNEQLDNRICPVCAEMHGKEFRVEDARSSLNTILNASSPDDLKLLQPWPAQTKESVTSIKNMSAAEMVQRNWHIPPYHPGCRGLLSHIGKTPTLESIKPSTVELGDAMAWVGWAAKLSKEQADTIKSYANNDFRRINSALREGIDTSTTEKTKKQLKALKEVFFKAPMLKSEKVLFRGLRYNETLSAQLLGLQAGDSWKDKGYVSTSVSQKVAYEATNKDGVEIEIRVPAGAQVVDVAAAQLTDLPGEGEVLINAGSEFKVLSIILNQDTGAVDKVIVELVL